MLCNGVPCVFLVSSQKSPCNLVLAGTELTVPSKPDKRRFRIPFWFLNLFRKSFIKLVFFSFNYLKEDSKKKELKLWMRPQAVRIKQAQLLNSHSTIIAITLEERIVNHSSGESKKKIIGIYSEGRSRRSSAVG